MSISRILLGTTLAVFVGVVIFAALSGKGSFTNMPAAVVNTTVNNTSANASTTASGGTQAPVPVTTGGYTMATVATHNSASSCWAAVNGNAYDLTKWINQHPGGQAPILSLCGTDGSAAFNGQHGGERRPASELASFLLGPLSK